MNKLISVVAGCYNEADNIDLLYQRLVEVTSLIADYDFEFVLIDNCSTDDTAYKIQALCKKDSRVKLIVNARNFGHVRSPYHALMQASGSAAICMASDLQDPPELIPELIRQWEKGASVAAAVYERSNQTGALASARKLYYRIIDGVSEASPIPAFTGFGLYDRRVIELLRVTGGPYPYVRGLVSELGLPTALVPFKKEERKFGFTKNNFLTLVDLAILGLTSMSRAPIRFATLLGASMSFAGFGIALLYLLAKILFWGSFPLGQAPLLIGIFLFGSVQILVAGLIGEYVASLHQRAQNHPHVVELYRINFPAAPSASAPPEIGPNRLP